MELMKALANGPASWFRSHPAQNFISRAEFPYYTHTDRYCSDAVATSITIDFLRGGKFGICPRVDCQKPFALERKGKVYCTQYCAHVVSQRRKRAREKLSKPTNKR
jgi:hypothetical protein